MTAAVAVIVLAVIAAVTAGLVIRMWLRHLDADHRDHRDFLVKMAALGGPENTRAAGEAFTSLAPAPTVRVRTSRTEVALGPGHPSPPNCVRPGADHPDHRVPRACADDPGEPARPPLPGTRTEGSTPLGA